MGNDYQRVFYKFRFSFPQDIFWTIWLQFRAPPRKRLQNSEKVLFSHHRKILRFLEKFLKAFWRRRIPLGQAWRKNFAKVEFYRSKCQIDIKKRCFLKKNFSKNQRTHNMKCSLDNHAENCSPELRKIFGRSEKKPIELQFIKLYFTQNVSLEL